MPTLGEILDEDNGMFARARQQGKSRLVLAHTAAKTMQELCALRTDLLRQMEYSRRTHGFTHNWQVKELKKLQDEIDKLEKECRQWEGKTDVNS